MIRTTITVAESGSCRTVGAHPDGSRRRDLRRIGSEVRKSPSRAVRGLHARSAGGGSMRTSVPAALAAFVLSLPVLLLGAAPAQAASIFLEVTPSTARPGDHVGLRAGC